MIRNETIFIAIKSEVKKPTSFFFSLKAKIQNKIDRILNTFAFGNQFNQIENIRKVLPEIATYKKAILENHIKTVSNFSKISLGLKLKIERINIIRTIIMRTAIHPAIGAYPFEKAFNEHWHAKNIQTNEERIDIFTKDHQLLDARIIYADKNKDKNKLTVVWFTGNMGCLGMSIEEASKIARIANVNILLYNPRGVGLSLGTEYTLDEAVEDGKAVIKHAFQYLCKNDPKRLGVYGLSLGGGISAAALNELQNEKVIKKIALYVNHQSFPSLQHCVKGLKRKVPTMITRLGLALIRTNPLNTGHVLTKKTLADETIVLTAGNDQIMKGFGRLENYLEKNANSLTRKIEYIYEPYAYHCSPINAQIFRRNQTPA
jgi:hypothetical protein